jgi:branched-chain amino acid aminotransferase
MRLTPESHGRCGISSCRSSWVLAPWRAAGGGIGAAKVAANYAPSLRASSAALARGLMVALWLDAREPRFIQELSGMNLFAMIDGELHTPELDGAILPGVPRDSLLRLAAHGY